MSKNVNKESAIKSRALNQHQKWNAAVSISHYYCLAAVDFFLCLFVVRSFFLSFFFISAQWFSCCFIVFGHALNLFLKCFQMEPITDTQLTATNTLTSCPTATIMSGNSSGSSASTHHHHHHHATTLLNPKTETALSPAGGEAQTTTTGSMATSKEDEEDSSVAASSDCKSPGQRYVNPFVNCVIIC